MSDEFTKQAGDLPLGFRWGAVKAGIKGSGNLDLAAAVVTGGGQAAACFTSNLVAAAPITVGRRHLLATGGRVSAVLVNAGNANCATGEPGIEDCLSTCVAAAQTLGCLFDEVFPSSTGIIGVPLPTGKLLSALPALRASLGETSAHATDFATAILTTDTRLKVARAVVDVDGTDVHLFGVAKGAGMIAPQLSPPVAGKGSGSGHATMLVYIFTDLEATAEELRAFLAPSVEQSFNTLSIDGDTSTNDTVLLLASGASGVTASEPRVSEAFRNALDLVCGSLAHAIVADGEGVTHVVNLHVTGAATESDARLVARTIANSPLCKTAWSSGDPNWGRLLAAAGRSGVLLEPAKMTISIAGYPVFAHGVRSPAFDEAATHTGMSAREYTIAFDLGLGTAECRFLTCDLTAEYVRINADYST